MARRFSFVASVIGVCAGLFFFYGTPRSVRAVAYENARATAFDGDFVAPEGASSFCGQVYAGMESPVSILLTLQNSEELVGANIDSFYTVIDGGSLVPVRDCFDQDATNDPAGTVLALESALTVLYRHASDAGGIGWALPGYTNGCPPNWDGHTEDYWRPGWWQGEQDKFRLALEEAIAANEPGLSLEEGSLRWYAPRVEVGPGVTTMDLPTWMRNLIIPYCDLSPEELAAARSGADRPGPEGGDLSNLLSLFVASETQALYVWIDANAPGITLEEAAQRWVAGNAVGWVDTPIAPWGICAPVWMEPQSLASAGLSVPSWISSRIVGFNPRDCE